MSDEAEGREPQPPDINEDAIHQEATEPESTGDPGVDENGEIALAQSGQDEGLRELLADNFLEYASYVIKDRAIPDVNDGLKPVQRRILHSLYELDDGRFHKVANIIGHTMRYHPHGDMSIGNALVVLANKEYFIDRQGNFGNIYTGDQASASRYIECRLTPLAREVLFNPEITEFIDSYDGRNREPVTLPAKVPSLLMIGSEGIAVGMSTRILPHNFIELLEAQIAILREKPFQVYPDFLTGGIMDVADYADGRGRVKVRARIDVVNDKTLVIRELPAGTTTESLTNSVEAAARKGKLKVVSIHDYTAETPEIEIRLARGEHAAEAIKRLYAYTDCEVSLSSRILIIRDQRPVGMTVSEIVRYTTDRLVRYLERELEILLRKLQERFHEKTLAQIFVENRIYKRIEECETWDSVLQEVRSGLEAFRHMLRRDITDQDIEKLLQLQIRRISRFDIDKNRKDIDDIVRGIEEAEDNLAHLTRYTIRYIKSILKKYGAQFPRRTEIADLESINIKEVALENLRVGHDRVNRFVGTDVRNSNKNEPYIPCSEFDHLLLLQRNGRLRVVPVSDKLYVGPIKYLFKADKQQVYSMIYRHRKTGAYYAKRFRCDRYILNREYTTIPAGCVVENLYTNSGIVIRCEHEPAPRIKQAHVDVVFDEIPIRSTGARGFKVTGHRVRAMVQIKRGTAAVPESDAKSEGPETPVSNQTVPPPGGTPSTGAADESSTAKVVEKDSTVPEPDATGPEPVAEVAPGAVQTLRTPHRPPTESDASVSASPGAPSAVQVERATDAAVEPAEHGPKAKKGKAGRAKSAPARGRKSAAGSSSAPKPGAPAAAKAGKPAAAPTVSSADAGKQKRSRRKAPLPPSVEKPSTPVVEPAEYAPKGKKGKAGRAKSAPARGRKSAAGSSSAPEPVAPVAAKAGKPAAAPTVSSADAGKQKRSRRKAPASPSVEKPSTPVAERVVHKSKAKKVKPGRVKSAPVRGRKSAAGSSSAPEPVAPAAAKAGGAASVPTSESTDAVNGPQQRPNQRKVAQEWERRSAEARRLPGGKAATGKAATAPPREGSNAAPEPDSPPGVGSAAPTPAHERGEKTRKGKRTSGKKASMTSRKRTPKKTSDSIAKERAPEGPAKTGKAGHGDDAPPPEADTVARKPDRATETSAHAKKSAAAPSRPRLAKRIDEETPFQLEG